jgi:hypothetical protein
VTESFGTARAVTAERATEGLPKESGRAIADQALLGSFRARRSEPTEVGHVRVDDTWFFQQGADVPRARR